MSYSGATISLSKQTAIIFYMAINIWALRSLFILCHTAVCFCFYSQHHHSHLLFSKYEVLRWNNIGWRISLIDENIFDMIWRINQHILVGHLNWWTKLLQCIQYFKMRFSRLKTTCIWVFLELICLSVHWPSKTLLRVMHQGNKMYSQWL